MIQIISTQTASGSSTAPSVTAPSNVAGDVLIVAISHNDGTLTMVDNNGSTPTTESLDFDTTGTGAGGMGLSLYYRVMGSSEPSTYSYTMSGSNRWAIVAFTVRGVHADIWDTAPAATTTKSLPGTTVDCASTTTTNANSMAIAIGTIDGTAQTWNTALPGAPWVEIGTNNAQQPITVWRLPTSGPGATGSVTLTGTGSIDMIGLNQFSIKNAVTVVNPAYLRSLQ